MAQLQDQPPAQISAPQLQLLKQLRIHSGALKRYAKELNSYLEELKGLKDGLEKMRTSNDSDDQKENRLKQIEIRQQVCSPHCPLWPFMLFTEPCSMMLSMSRSRRQRMWFRIFGPNWCQRGRMWISSWANWRMQCPRWTKKIRNWWRTQRNIWWNLRDWSMTDGVRDCLPKSANKSYFYHHSDTDL